MHWLTELVDEFDTKDGISDGRIERLSAVFADKPDGVMEAAVLEYMKSGGRYFPRVGELMPHVERAERFTDDSVAGPVDALDYGPTEEEALALLAGWGKCPECGTQQDARGVCLYAFNHVPIGEVA